MGWGSKAIEIRAVETGQLDGVFMHKRTQKLRFLCERNDKVCVCCLCGTAQCVHFTLSLPPSLPPSLTPSLPPSSPGLLCQHPHLLLQSGLLYGSQQKSGAAVTVGLAPPFAILLFCVLTDCVCPWPDVGPYIMLYYCCTCPVRDLITSSVGNTSSITFCLWPCVVLILVR